MQLLTGYVKPIVALAISPDGQRLFSVAWKHARIWEWDLASVKVVNKRTHEYASDGVTDLTLASTGDFLLSTSNNNLNLWPLRNDNPQPLDSTGSANLGASAVVAIHPKRQLIAASLHRYNWQQPKEYGWQLWDLTAKNRNSQYVGLSDCVVALAFSSDGSRIATASPGFVCLWDVETGKQLRVFSRGANPSSLSFHPSYNHLVVSVGRSVLVLDSTTLEAIGELRGHNAIVRKVAYSPNGEYLISTAADGSVILRDGTTREVVGQRNLDIGEVSSLCWRADSTGVVAGGEKVIALCDMADLQGIRKAKPKGDPLTLAGHKRKITSLAYSPDGRALVSCDYSGAIRVWDLSGGAGQAKEKAVFGDFDAQPVCRPTWSPGGKRLAVWSWGNARTCAADGTEICRITAPDSIPRFLTYTPTGRLLVGFYQRLEVRDGEGTNVLSNLPYQDTHHPVVSADNQRVYFVWGQRTVCLWKPESGEILPLFEQDTLLVGLEVKSDEQLALSIGGNAARLWSLPECKQLAVMKHPMMCTGAMFAPDGRLVTASYDGVVRVWESNGRSELYAFDLGMGRIYSLAVSPDGMTFAAGVHKSNRIVLMDLPE